MLEDSKTLQYYYNKNAASIVNKQLVIDLYHGYVSFTVKIVKGCTVGKTENFKKTFTNIDPLTTTLSDLGNILKDKFNTDFIKSKHGWRVGNQKYHSDHTLAFCGVEKKETNIYFKEMWKGWYIIFKADTNSILKFLKLLKKCIFCVTRIKLFCEKTFNFNTVPRTNSWEISWNILQDENLARFL